MPKFRIDSIAELAGQLRFTPAGKLHAQLAAAEDLLHDLTPDRAYPLDFVVYRVTGYHPKVAPAELLTGVALQHDLGLLIEQASDLLKLDVRGIEEPVLAIDDVCERFNVTSKTIQRWRRRGLPGRHFVFTDGKRRVGFLLSSVERFFSGHGEQVARGMNFALMTDDERALIVRHARRLARECGCDSAEIARRIGRRLNRSPLTVLHTLRKHDFENAEAILAAAAEPIEEADRTRIIKGFRRGISLRAMGRKLGRRRSTVYRVIIEERLARLNRRKVRFIDDPLYYQDDSAAVIHEIVGQQELAESGEERAEEQRVPQGLPPYLQELYRTPLLGPTRQRAMFLQFNFHKYQFVEARRRLEVQFARARDLDELESYLCQAAEIKNQIVAANLRLVVSISRKHLRPGLSLMELISEGNMILMRAVESFDAHKGYRLSTYATLALVKGFARIVPAMQANLRRDTAALVAELPDRHAAPADRRIVERDQVAHLLTRLDDRERSIVRDHWGIDQSAPASYDQLARRWGLSKQRVRQIERGAIEKLRSDMIPE